jgi:TPR repeat protein
MGFFKKGKRSDKGKEPEFHQNPQGVIMDPVQTSQTYQDILNERKSLLCERGVLLADQSFKNLNEQKQIEHCRLNKRLMENYWHGFETLKKDAFFEAAAQDFQEALYIGYDKAGELLKTIQSIHSKATEENEFFSEDVDSYTKGLCFHIGLGCQQNHNHAFQYYQEAAGQGDARAQFNLGYCYRNGIGTEKNEKEAVRLYTLAAEQGCANAQNNLGHCYQYGIGTVKNEGEAVRLFTLAAEQGNVCAQNNLGHCYQYGIGTAENEKKAVRLYTLAAEQGLSNAKNNLGYCYRNGIGTEKNEKEAVRLYTLAAEKGNDVALNNLKIMKTPLANYKLALIEKNYQQMTELAINHDELREVFFKDDFIVIAQGFKNIQHASDLLAFLNESAQKANKNINSLLITTLLQLNKNTELESPHENIEVLNYLLTELLNMVSLADAEAEQVKDLMHFLINHFDDNYQESFIDELIILWHRAQALKVQLDNTALNRLIADKVIHYLFKGEYCLVFNGQLSRFDLGMILLNYKEQPRVTVEELNRRLSEPLLVKSQYLGWGHLTQLKRTCCAFK